MTFKSILAATSTAVILAAGAASAGSVSNIDADSVDGTFTAKFSVTAVNVVGLSSSESQATMENYSAALAETLGSGGAGPDPVLYATDTFQYEGALNFGTSVGDTTTISEFLGSAGGTLTDLDTTFGDLVNSTANINNSTATTTFYLFSILGGGGYSAGSFDIAHDDGVLIEGGGGVAGPTSERGTRIDGFAGGKPVFLYVSTNSDPSIFRVDGNVTQVPLPAAGWMLLAGVAALGAAKRRRKAA
jgi:hypothetical protein